MKSPNDFVEQCLGALSLFEDETCLSAADRALDDATYAQKIQILEEFGERNLGRFPSALSAGWRRVVDHLAYNALLAEVKERVMNKT